MKQKKRLNEAGSLLLPFIIILLLFLGAAGFGVWAFVSRQDYKNNSDDKAAVAAKAAAAVEATKKDAEYAVKEKSPLKTFNGSSTYGNLTFQYSKNWSLYTINETIDRPLDSYFNPDAIPDIKSGKPYAFRIQVINVLYATYLKAYDSDVASGKVTLSPYRLPKVPSALGSTISGSQINGTIGTFVLLPIRDKTLVVWTEGTKYLSDFTSIILPSISFTP
jgi:hypothetical protein